jgi:hypothetical protein
LADGDLSVRGALVAQSFSVPGGVGLHFNPAVLSAGASCNAAATSAVSSVSLSEE